MTHIFIHQTPLQLLQALQNALNALNVCFRSSWLKSRDGAMAQVGALLAVRRHIKVKGEVESTSSSSLRHRYVMDIVSVA